MSPTSGIQPSIGPVHTGCLCCGSKPETPEMDWRPHPGFGMLDLTRDGERPDWWNEFASIVRWAYYIDQGWQTVTIQAGPRKGQDSEFFDGDWYPEWAVESLTLGEIDECCAEDPDHDWRLTVHGPMYGAVWQRHGDKLWHPIERLDGFA